MEREVKKNHRTRKELLLGALGVFTTIGLCVAGVYYKDELTDMGNITRYGLIGILIIAFIAGSTFSVTAIPVPYWIITLTLPTLLASEYGIWSPVWVGLLSGLGAAIGQFLTFMIGYGGRSISEKVSYRFNSKIYDKAVEWTKKRGSWAVFLMSLLANPLHLPMTIAIAALKYPPLKFLLFTFLGVTLKSLVLAFAGYFGLTSLLDWLASLKTTTGLVLWLVLVLLLTIVAGLIIWQVMVLILETRDKNNKYNAARDWAEKMGKPLLVGNPWGVKPYRRWMNMPAHGGGDVVLDIDHKALKGQPGAVLGSITHLPFADRAFGAVFMSHVLEHLPTTEDAEKALGEMSRVSESVFVVYPSRQSIGGWLTRDHRLWVWQSGGLTYLKQRGKRGNREKVVVETAHKNV